MDRGQSEEQTQCPGALAIKEQVGSGTPVYVDEDAIFVSDQFDKLILLSQYTRQFQ